MNAATTFIYAALNRDDIANYVNALFIVYIILIFARVLLSWIPRMPYNPRWPRSSTSSTRPPTPT